MVAKVFIDGEVGTTGLQIAQRLRLRDDIALISLPEETRKDLNARVDALCQADVGILCLPDAASKEIAAAVAGENVRLIDASTAHRVDLNWDFGFAEIGPEYRRALEASARVSNPGCYSSAAIALLAPLTAAGLIAGDAPISINAVSGYSGGGKALIQEFEAGEVDGHFAYATAQGHKHVPEIMRYGGLSQQPIFVPSVGHFAQGMLVQIPLPFLPASKTPDVQAALASHYSAQHFVRYVDHDAYGARIDPRMLNDTNYMDLSVKAAPDGRCCVLYAVLDNLGKGASGAAVQNLNIMLGLDETVGLSHA